MSDAVDSSAPEKRPGLPPVALVLALLAVATAGSAFVVMPDDQSPITVSSAMVIPGPDSGSTKTAANSSVTNSTDAPESTNRLPDPEPSETQALSSIDKQKKAEENRQSQLLIGNWRQTYYGERTLSVKADGTATMTIIPSSLWAVAFGERIDLTMFWSVKDGHLDYGISGGTPADKVQLAAKTWGDKWVEKIIALNESELDLLSVDGTTHSIWERVPENTKPAKESGTTD